MIDRVYFSPCLSGGARGFKSARLSDRGVDDYSCACLCLERGIFPHAGRGRSVVNSLPMARFARTESYSICWLSGLADGIMDGWEDGWWNGTDSRFAKCAPRSWPPAELRTKVLIVGGS